MTRFAALAAAVAAALAAAAYHCVLDGGLPAQSDYALDIEAARTLAGAGDGLPTAINAETLARSPLPAFTVRAGGGLETVHLARTVFQIVTPAGDIVLEAGMDRALAETYAQADAFSDRAWADVQRLMANAQHIIVTHEHPDHIGGLVRTGDTRALAAKARLTAPQVAALPAYTQDGAAPAAFEPYAPLTLDAPRRIAPGVVMIPAPGHTPGSVLVYVRLQSGAEFLFIGDIAFTEENVTQGVDRPRLTRRFMVTPEDRAAVVSQLRALHELSKAEPDLYILPAHADAMFKRLIAQGIIGDGFTGLPA